MSLNFNEYQKQALTTDDSKGSDPVSAQFFAILLGFAGEAGEISEKFKKIYWHKEGILNDEDKKLLAKELGDVLWYTSSLASHLGVSLEEIAQSNLNKLKDRVDRGVHRGFGDER